MKILQKINRTIVSMRSSIKRFPLTVLISVILTFLLIYIQESRATYNINNELEKLSMVLGLGIPLSLGLKLLSERFFNEDRPKSYLIHILGAGFLLLYYFVFLNGNDMISMIRYAATMMFLILAFLYIPRIKKDLDYEYYIMDLYYGFAITFIYSLVLYLGIAAILLTIDGLFDVNIPGRTYYYMFLIVGLIFGVSLFSSKIPNIHAKYERDEYTKPLKVLILYIVIPLISIYTAILYVYFGKILITMEWPKGLVSHLVVWYSTISVGIIFLITPILEESKVAKIFKIWFPKIVLPVLLMMFISIWQRVSQYGITENRYYLIVLAIWVTGIMLYFSLKKPLKNIIIPISLSIIMLNSVFGPLSSFAISKGSQNRRLGKILNNNSMIENGGVVPSDSISSKDKKEINNIVTYFKRNHQLREIKYFPEDLDIDNIEKLTGFKYQEYYDNLGGPENQFEYGTNNSEEVITIKDYDYYLNLNTWNNSNRDLDGLKVRYNSDENIIIFLKDNEIIGEEDVKEFIKDIHEKQSKKELGPEKRYEVHIEDATYEVEILLKNMEGIKMKFVLNNVYGEINNEDELKINNIDFILLIKKQ